MSTTVWGDAETRFFFELTPDRILDAVEASGLRCTGRVLTLNSMENRVYEVELELDEGTQVKSPSERFRIVKFYRPGRWSRAQILEEHQFLKDLAENEIPVVQPLLFSDGETLRKVEGQEIWYSVFPKVGGRSPDELTAEQLPWIGRLLARLHQVGAARPAEHRLLLNPTTYGRNNLQFLVDSKSIPLDLREPYQKTVEAICDLSDPLFKDVPIQRIHGDCHLGNLLWAPAGPFFVDFDDMVRGPCVQDIWLLVPGRDDDAKQARDQLLEGYEQFHGFDYTTLRLVEPLRALRFIHFSAWIAKRWQDPAFPRAFPHFGTARYWEEQLQDLKEQLEWVQNL